MKRMLNYDPMTGIKTYHDYDHATQTTYISQEQDVEKILNRNEKLRNDNSYKRQGIKEDWYHFATIPNSIVVELKQKHNLDVFNDEDLPKIERLLASNEYYKLRTVNKI